MKKPNIIIVDDQLGSSFKNAGHRIDFLQKIGALPNYVNDEKEIKNDFPYQLEFHSGKDENKRNSIEAVEEFVRRRWPFHDGSRLGLVFLDVRFDQIPNGSNDARFGFILLRRLRQTFGTELPIVMLTQEGDENRPEANIERADGFLPKDKLTADAFYRCIIINGLVPDIRRRDMLLIGHSLPLLKSLREARRYAVNPIGGRIIYGESGVGKTEYAKYIHDFTGRPGNFTKWTAAYTNDDLLKNHLFGHWKGAFSGADSSLPGEIEKAHKGTFLLDEIADLTQAGQSLMMEFRRRDEEGFRTIRRLGILPTSGEARKEAIKSVFGTLQSDDSIKVDVLMLTATNRNLRDNELRKQIGFRPDLYADLGEPIVLPTLNERREDIREVFEYLVARVRDDRETKIDEKVFSLLENHDWANENVVALKRAAEVAATNLRDFDEILIRHLPESITATSASAVKNIAFLSTPAGGTFTQDSIKAPEKPILESTLRTIETRAGLSKLTISYLAQRVDLLENSLEETRDYDVKTGKKSGYSPTRALTLLTAQNVSATAAKRLIKEIFDPIFNPTSVEKKYLESNGLPELRKRVQSSPMLMQFYRYSTEDGYKLENVNAVLEGE